MVHQDSDDQRIQRIAAGDEDALRELYAVHGQRLYAYALRLTNDPILAEDALQESLVAVWQGAKRYKGDGRLSAWLLKIVHNKAINSLNRAIKNHARNAPLEGPGQSESSLPAPGALPDTLSIQKEQRQILRGGMEELSLEQRTALDLVFYQGLSLNEVAEVTGCPVGTIKSRLNYAKASLRGYLNRKGLHAEDVE